MSIIDLKGQDSISVSMEFCDLYKQKDSLLLGPRYQTYLYFDLPECLYSYNLTEAKLVVFKILPYGFIQGQDVYSCSRYNLYPLLDFFSIYSCAFSPPDVDLSRKVTFYDDFCSGYSEVDITQIVRDWKDEKIENKGLFLTGEENSQYISYASSRYEIPGMRPMIRLKCEGIEICRTLSSAACAVKVND